MPAVSLSRTHTHIMLLMSLIAGVGFFDFMVLLYMADTIKQVFLLPNTGWLYYSQLIGLFMVGCIASPLGGFLIGRYGDTYGRKPALFISLCILAICTLAMGFIPFGGSLIMIAPLLLLLARFGQNMAFGGQLPTMWVFVAEHLPKRYFGISCALILAGCLGSLLFLSILINTLENNLTHTQMLDFGWRIPFLLSGSISFFLLFAVYKLDETPEFTRIQHNACPTTTNKAINMHTLPQDNLHRKHHPPIKQQLILFVPALVLSWILSSLFVVLAVLLPDLIGAGFVLTDGFLSFGRAISLFFMLIGCIFYGFLVDYVNIGKVMLFGGILLVLQLVLFFGHLKTGGELILIFFAMLGFAGGVMTSIPVVLVRLFPIKNRLTNIATTYNVVYALVSSVLPFVLGYVTFSLRLAPALYLMLVALAMIFISFYIYYLAHYELDPSEHSK